jgi:cellulose synthase/poly-beta-1,6-N-acetylglucosamine synthase-like glycosyltransferase
MRRSPIVAGVSFVVPVRNGGAHLTDTIASIASQGANGRAVEIIVVDDGSTDESTEVLRTLSGRYPIQLVLGPGRGAAAAVNAGIRRATHPIVCQVDQDVEVEPGWTDTLVTALDDPAVGAAQGCYVPDPHGSFFVRVMGLDLAQRYARLGDVTSHVCTGNSAYRVSALEAIGLLDESLGYGYDNDLSYRLQAAGYQLRFCREARSRHRWREGLMGYLSQQYGFGYGRLDVVARHRDRLAGDAVSPAGMMGHPLALGAALLCFGIGTAAWVWSGRSFGLFTIGAILVALLMLERTVAGVRAWRQFGDPAALTFPAVHLARDIAWVTAIGAWAFRRVRGTPDRPEHSMSVRRAAR